MERQTELVLPPQIIRASDTVRLTMSTWQTVGVVAVAIGIVVGAIGIAALSWVTMHDWGCRTGVFESYCPAAPAQKEPPRADIPA